jgi:hypothetical protein
VAVTDIDITRPEGFFLVCPACGHRLSVPPDWRDVWATNFVRCQRGHEPATMDEVVEGG